MFTYHRLAVIILALQLLVGCCPNYRTDLEFDSVRWKSGDYCARASMSPNLQSSGLLKGKSMDEVEELLGPPDEIFSPNKWSYKANFVARCSVIWYCYSSIRFDEKTGKTNGRVLVSD